MSNFISGPWERDGVTIYTLEVVPGKYWDGIPVERNTFSCYVEGYNRLSAEEVEATAQLIQASPDLLEACERTTRFITTVLESGSIVEPDASAPDSAHDVLLLLRAAIAKARGEK